MPYRVMLIMVVVKWKAPNFVRWGVGLLLVGVVVSRFVWPEKVVDVEVPHGRLGNMEQAGKLVEEMRAASKKGPVSALLLATAYVGMSKQKEAMQALEEGYRTHDADMAGLNATPWLEPLRSDARFQDLVKRMNFPTLSRPAQQ